MGGSGPVFVDNAAFRQYAHDVFGARVLDMESAAVAHVAYVSGVPFIAYCSDAEELERRGVTPAACITSLLDLPAALA